MRKEKRMRKGKRSYTIMATPVHCNVRILKEISELCTKIWEHICGFVWLNRTQTTVVGLFTKTDGTHRIKRQNKALPSSSPTSPIRICAFIYTSNIQRRQWFLKMWATVFVTWWIPAQWELKCAGGGARWVWEREGQLPISLLSPQPKGRPNASLFHKLY